MAFTPTEEAQLRAVITAFESGKTISEIAASTEVFTTDVLEIVQSAVSKKATIAQIITLVNSELGIGSMSTKLSGIEAGAQVNVIESVKVNSTVLPISSKSVDITVPTQPSDIGAQASLGFTPEQAGVAASLITALKNGVPTEGDTLKKLYDLIVASFSEVQVATIAARDEYNITKLPTNVFVLDDGDSKWALYKATTTGVNATYVKLSDPDLLNAVMTASQIAISYESVDDVNRFTDALKTKLDAFTANFTVELKAAYDGKQNSLTIGNLTSTTSGVTIGNGTGAVIGSGATVNIATAGASSDGILTSGHFNTFNNKVSNATHTGDVIGSTALTLATVNSSVGTFNNVTINAKGLATAGSNVSYEPSFSKNTGFNKNFGTTTGTVLEGRTFGTAANSAVGDFQPTITGLTTNYIPKWNGSSFVNSLIQDFSGNLQVPQGSDFSSGGYTNGFGTIVSNGAILNVYPQGNQLTGTFRINSTTPSTSPTTGALVVGGGVGANHIETSYLEFSTLGIDNNGIYTKADSIYRLRLFSNGNVGIDYTSDQGYKLAVNGSGYFNGNVTASGEITAYSSSDIRLKENIQPLNKSLELINKLNPVSYNWNEKAKELNQNKDEKKDVGVIAQELEKVLPNLVHNIYNDEFLAVDYVKLIPYLIGAVQELTDKINKLENNK